MHVYTRWLSVAALALTSAAAAGAQNVTGYNKPFSFGVMGGAAVPTGDLSSGFNTGYNLTGMLGLNTPDLPVNFRINVGYSSFGPKTTINTGDAHVWEFSGNGTYTFPSAGASVQPYVTGGLGMYNTPNSASGYSTGSANHFGFNVGGGLTIPLSGMNAFVEARYIHASGDYNTSTAFVPIVFGLTF